MSTRIDHAFARCREEDRAAFIPFIMGGDPNTQISQTLLDQLADAGADIIELGIPFSDPMADGPVIQAAGQRALQAGAALRTVLAQAKLFRDKNSQTPLVLMGYANPIEQYGLHAFAKDAADAGVDGLILVDVPPEESAPIEAAFAPHGIALIRLIAPTSIPNRVEALVSGASGYLYLVSIAGITGAEGAKQATISGYCDEIRKHTNLPIAVGFGIKTPADVAALQQIADGVVVGSAIVEKVAALSDGGDVRNVVDFIRSLTK
jgi:tryptophan synthase alpha chain